MKLVFAAFLCACAWEDFKEKKIPVLFLWAAASVAAAWMAGYYMILLDWTDMSEAYLWLAMRGAALIPGMLLLAVSVITKGAVYINAVCLPAPDMKVQKFHYVHNPKGKILWVRVHSLFTPFPSSHGHHISQLFAPSEIPA